LNSKPKLSKKGGIEKNRPQGRIFLQNDYNNVYKSDENNRLINSLIMRYLCEYRTYITIILNNYVLSILNVKKYIINININLTLVTGSLHIFAPH